MQNLGCTNVSTIAGRLTAHRWIVLVLIPALWIAGFLFSTLSNEQRQRSQRGFSLVFQVMFVHLSFHRTHAFVQFLCMCVFHCTYPFFLSCCGCQQQQLWYGTVAVQSFRRSVRRPIPQLGLIYIYISLFRCIQVSSFYVWVPNMIPGHSCPMEPRCFGCQT